MNTAYPFHIMAKVNGPICNMDCTYCYYLEKENLYPGTTNWAMKKDVLENFVKQYIESQETQNIDFMWQGGEPLLLGKEYFENVIGLQKKYADGKTITNSLQTNAILLEDEWCELFNKNNFLIGVSIDGPQEIHDKYRVLKGGQPTFSKVLNGIKLLQTHNVEFNTLTCIQKDNSYHGVEVYNFLKEIGSQYMQFIPIVERIAMDSDKSKLNLVQPNYSDKAEVTEWSVESLQFGKFFSEIFDEWVKKDVGKYYVQLFDLALEAWFGRTPSLCVFQEKCGRAVVLEHNGDLYSCDHYVYPENKLGNIMDNTINSMVNSEQQIKFGDDKLTGLPKYCVECDYKFMCNGECPKHRFLYSPDGEYGLNYLCAGYKYLFNHIDPYMKIMANELANERPPANVMVWAEEKDKGFPSLKVNRNDNCPCGSGKKYKNCCCVN